MMEDLTGKRFGKLKVIGPAFQYGPDSWYWHCRCSCGKRIVEKGSVLERGKRKSCGCMRGGKKKRKKWTPAYEVHGNTVHGDCRGGNERLYRIWCNMKARCNRENHPAYSRYGGRGVKICEDWSDYVKFREWAFVSGYEDGMTIDRVDNDGDYCPENCQWLTKSQHSKKTNLIDRKGGEA